MDGQYHDRAKTMGPDGEITNSYVEDILPSINVDGHYHNHEVDYDKGCDDGNGSAMSLCSTMSFSTESQDDIDIIDKIAKLIVQYAYDYNAEKELDQMVDILDDLQI